MNLNYISRLTSYRAVNTHPLGYRTNGLMMCKKIIADYFKVQKKHKHTICGLNAEFLNVKRGGTHHIATTGPTQWKQMR